ncbi:MAG: carboxymuconolactone decarboxylase family protein [Alphaproteobacteria bacterium]|nr:carboxymuconolactone decarboxylase family protein [Alphaproteobacteria bacterium]
MTTREALFENGEAMRTTLRVEDTERAQAEGGTAPGFEQMITETAYGALWTRPGLSLQDRMICTLSALCVQPHAAALKRFVGAALDIGLDARAILEVFVQCGLYGGFPLTETASAVAKTVFTERGIAIAAEPDRDESLDVLQLRGDDLLADLHGARGRQGYAAPDNPVTDGLYSLAIQYGYGELWFRPGLDRRSRMLCALAAFTALRLESQVRKFSQSAIALGLTREEVVEAVMQTAPYSGFPPALNALAAISEVLSAD